MKSAAHDAAESYTHDACIRTDTHQEPHVHAEEMGETSVFMPITGVQVVGTGAHPSGDGRFLAAHYWSPAILQNGLTATSGGGVRMIKDSDRIGWVWLPDHSGKVRLFPEMTPGSDGKRLQTVQYGPYGQIWMTRNGEVDRIWRIYQVEDGWQLTTHPLILQGGNTDGYIESMNVSGTTVAILRSRQDGSPAWLEVYSTDGTLEGGKGALGEIEPPESPWIYGLDWWAGGLYYVTDALCTSVTHGIYRGSKLVVPGVTGSSIFFDARGNAILPQFGENIGDQGRPCTWTRVPAVLLGHHHL